MNPLAAIAVALLVAWFVMVVMCETRASRRHARRVEDELFEMYRLRMQERYARSNVYSLQERRVQGVQRRAPVLRVVPTEVPSSPDRSRRGGNCA